MYTRELWLTQEEIRLMLNGRLTWDEATRAAYERGLEDERARTKLAESGNDRDGMPLENSETEYIEQTWILDHRDGTGKDFYIAGAPVIALVSGTGLLTFFLWFYLILG